MNYSKKSGSLRLKTKKLHGILKFLHEAEKLKTVLRHSYLSDGRQEDVAQHTWRMALMAVVLHQEMEKRLI